MTKREPGYDPAHGDWEYAYVSLAAGSQPVTRGKIASCIDCHGRPGTTDHLYRPYLTGGW